MVELFYETSSRVARFLFPAIVTGSYQSVEEDTLNETVQFGQNGFDQVHLLLFERLQKEQQVGEDARVQPAVFHPPGRFKLGKTR